MLSDFYQTLGDKFTFQQENNLKYKAESTLEFLTKTVSLMEWPSYSFYLKLLENPVAKLENGCLAITNNQFDRD